jgi:hypothetical protein
MWELLAVGYVLKPVYITFFVYREMDVSSGDILDLHGILERVEIDNFNGLLQLCPRYYTKESHLVHEGSYQLTFVYCFEKASVDNENVTWLGSLIYMFSWIII